MATYTGIGFDATNAKIVKPTSTDTTTFTGSMAVGGDLTVSGDIISAGAKNLVVTDPMIDLGVGAGAAGQVTGFSFSVQQGSNPTTFSAINHTTGVITVNAVGTLAAGDIISVTGSSDAANNGLYYIASISGSDITIDTTVVDSAPFLQTAFNSTTSGETGDLAQVDLKVLAVSDGTHITGTGISAGTLVEKYAADATTSDFGQTSYNVLVPAAVATDLQVAYNNGALITTASSTAIAFDLTSGGFTVDDGVVSFGGSTALTSFDMLAGSVAIDSQDSISLTGANTASNFTVDSANLTLATTTSGTLAVSSAGSLDMDGVAVTLDGSNGVSIDGSGSASNFSSTGQNLTISTITSGTLAIDSAGVLAIDSDDTTNLTMTANNATQKVLTISATNIDGTGTAKLALQADDVLALIQNANEHLLASAGATTIKSFAGQPLTILSNQNLDMDGTVVTLDGSSGVSIDGSGSASNFSSTGQNLTISTITSGTLAIDSAGVLTIDSDDTTNLTMTANNAGTKTLLVSAINNGAGNGILQLNATASTAVVKTTIGGSDKLLINNTSATFSDKLFATSGASFLSLTTDATGVNAGDLVAINASGNATKADADGSGTRNAIGFALETAGATSPVKIAQTGVVTGLSSLTAGTKYYMSTTAGGLTATAPTASGSTVFQAGIAISTTSLAIQLQFIIENP